MIRIPIPIDVSTELEPIGILGYLKITKYIYVGIA
jgi:hypothetical protein